MKIWLMVIDRLGECGGFDGCADGLVMIVMVMMLVVKVWARMVVRLMVRWID